MKVFGIWSGPEHQVDRTRINVTSEVANVTQKRSERKNISDRPDRRSERMYRFSGVPLPDCHTLSKELSVHIGMLSFPDS